MTSRTLELVIGLVSRRQVRISEHGYDELAKDGFSVREIVEGVHASQVVEDYPDFAKGPCVLVLQRDAAGGPVHAVWGIPQGNSEPAVLVTAYRPDPTRWSADFMTRRR